MRTITHNFKDIQGSSDLITCVCQTYGCCDVSYLQGMNFPIVMRNQSTNQGCPYGVVILETLGNIKKKKKPTRDIMENACGLI